MTFDLGALARAIDDERRTRDLSWSALAHEVGVASSTLRRFTDALDAEADGVLAAVRWLGVPPEHFVNGASVSGDPLPTHDNGMIRVDLDLLASLSGEAALRQRTTIQHLVVAATRAGHTIASLTRWSAV